MTVGRRARRVVVSAAACVALAVAAAPLPAVELPNARDHWASIELEADGAGLCVFEPLPDRIGPACDGIDVPEARRTLVRSEPGFRINGGAWARYPDRTITVVVSTIDRGPYTTAGSGRQRLVDDFTWLAR